MSDKIVAMNAGTVGEFLTRKGHAESYHEARHQFTNWYTVEVNGIQTTHGNRILQFGDVVTVHHDGVHTYTI